MASSLVSPGGRKSSLPNGSTNSPPLGPAGHTVRLSRPLLPAGQPVPLARGAVPITCNSAEHGGLAIVGMDALKVPMPPSTVATRTPTTHPGAPSSPG
jgi:hypothetical protein